MENIYALTRGRNTLREKMVEERMRRTTVFAHYVLIGDRTERKASPTSKVLHLFSAIFLLSPSAPGALQPGHSPATHPARTTAFPPHRQGNVQQLPEKRPEAVRAAPVPGTTLLPAKAAGNSAFPPVSGRLPAGAGPSVPNPNQTQAPGSHPRERRLKSVFLIRDKGNARAQSINP